MRNLNIIGVAIGLCGLAYGLYTQVKMEKIAGKLDKTVNELAANTEVTIEESILVKAAEKAVNREVSVLAHKAAISTVCTISSDMRKIVQEAVEQEYSNISKSVSDKLADQVSNIDIDVLRTKVTNKAQDKILEKFDGSLDGVLDNFNRELRNVSKIYSSIAGTMAPAQKEEPKYIHLQV